MCGYTRVLSATVLEASCLLTNHGCASMGRRVDEPDGQWRKSTRLRTSWPAQRTVPCRCRSQCSDVPSGENYGQLCQAITLSEPGATFVSDCATVLRGLDRGPKGAQQRRPHADVWRRIWERFQDIGNEAHIDSVTKCKAHQVRASQSGRGWPLHDRWQRTGRGTGQRRST